jgi:tRNA dimethylallyltransferase
MKNTQNPLEKKKVIVVAGPTASGKSDFAVELALKENGEVVSVDSRQMYKGLNIGAGKITEEEMKGAPHHMLNVYDVNDENVSVVTFTKDARSAIDDIFARGKIPILCGGGGQYLHALLYEKDFPKVEKNEGLRKILANFSTEELAQKLKEKDEHRFTTIDQNNRVRLIRALEICEAIGKVPTEEELSPRFDATIYLLEASPEILKKRIEIRLEKRLHAGMVDEVRGLLKSGVSAERLISLGLEYKYCSLFIQGTITFAEMKEQLKSKIWQYAKRQTTWNKKYLQNVIIVKVG